eukprot:6479895-Amphidinium_carterae.1
MSGRQAIVMIVAGRREAYLQMPMWARCDTEKVLLECCEKLGVSSVGSMCLVSGDDVVPAGAVVENWPGIRAPGEISEYQLVLQQS